MTPSTYARLVFALISLFASLWLVTHMPSDSAFDPVLRVAAFELWHGLVLLGSLSLSLLTARLLVRT